MQEIVLIELEKWINMTYMLEKGSGVSEEHREKLCTTADKSYIIIGPPCESLYVFQQAGHCVLAELTHLQGLSEEEVAEALSKEEAVKQFANVCINAEELPQGYLRRIWCKHVGEPVLIAETERLIIRESIVEDGSAFYELYQDEACRKYLVALPIEEKDSVEQNIKEYERYITDYQKGQYTFYEYGIWSLVEKASGRCIGRAGVELQAEGLGLGYAVLPKFRGKGYATEACLAILDYCRECGYGESVSVKIDEENETSRKVYERLIRGGGSFRIRI